MSRAVDVVVLRFRLEQMYGYHPWGTCVYLFKAAALCANQLTYFTFICSSNQIGMYDVHGHYAGMTLKWSPLCFRNQAIFNEKKSANPVFVGEYVCCCYRLVSSFDVISIA